ncbi:MAG: sulfotransferase family protein [Flavobacteriaceae bacterium]|nr:sulfotransferase family protein [Flavobacteriaceae bacterium]
MNLKNKNIFIHIPKTGGTTINCAMNNSEWQTQPDFNYRHIDYQTKRSNSADIFNPLKYDEYEAYNIFMLVRHPVDRIISEYSFIKSRREFMSLMKPEPKDFKSYIKNSQTQNYMLGFLIGNRMYDTKKVTKDDLDLVINSIKNLNIKVGLFEEYSQSLSYFSNHTDLNWPKNIDIKRITLNRPKLDEISKEIEELILSNNLLDLELYNFCNKRFDEVTKNSSFKKLKFTGNKYNYILKFTERFNLLEIELKDLAFIKLNAGFFEKLNLHLQKKLKIKDGQNYVSLWNEALLKSIEQNIPNSKLGVDLKNLQIKEDPLQTTIEIAKKINRNIRNTSQDVKTYRNKLILDTSEIKKPKKKFKWF